MSDFDDILGTVRRPTLRVKKAPLARKKRRENEAALARLADVTRAAAPAATGAEDPFAPMSCGTLAAAFGLEVSTVRNRLAACPPAARKTSGAVYRLKDAAPYLVAPRFDVEATLRQMKPQDLPEALRTTYWDAQLKRQKWEREAGHLWRSEDVIVVLGEVFKRIKHSVQLWVETVQQTDGLTPEQRTTLARLVDALQDDIYESMVEMTRERATQASIREVEQLDGLTTDRPANRFDDVL